MSPALLWALWGRQRRRHLYRWRLRQLCQINWPLVSQNKSPLVWSGQSLNRQSAKRVTTLKVKSIWSSIEWPGHGSNLRVTPISEWWSRMQTKYWLRMAFMGGSHRSESVSARVVIQPTLSLSMATRVALAPTGLSKMKSTKSGWDQPSIGNLPSTLWVSQPELWLNRQGVPP